jgi:hypothetical protein
MPRMLLGFLLEINVIWKILERVVSVSDASEGFMIS